MIDDRHRRNPRASHSNHKLVYSTCTSWRQ